MIFFWSSLFWQTSRIEEQKNFLLQYFHKLKFSVLVLGFINFNLWWPTLKLRIHQDIKSPKSLTWLKRRMKREIGENGGSTDRVSWICISVDNKIIFLHSFIIFSPLFTTHYVHNELISSHTDTQHSTTSIYTISLHTIDPIISYNTM